jgi:murein L,D-transpeptidase YafK
MSHMFRPALLSILAIVLVAPLHVCAQTQTKPPDRILILKSAHTMSLMHGSEILKTYKVALSTVPAGAKEHSGDHKVPEGIYIVDRKNPQSRFHLALHVSYPNVADRARAGKLGVDPGGNIEIHGLEKKYASLGALHRAYDWTDGCIAVTNAEIEEIYPQIRVGTPVEIRP